MTLRRRLSLTIAGIVVLLVLPSLYGVSQLRTLRDLARLQRQNYGNAHIALGAVQSNLLELARSATQYNVEPDADRLAAMLKALDVARGEITKLKSGYPVAAQRTDTHIDSIGVAVRRLQLLMDADRKDDATGYLDTLKALVTGTDPILRDVSTEIDQRSQQNLDEAGAISTRAAVSSLIALFICLAVAAALGAWTTRALTQPVIRLRNAVAVVADGDFTVPRDLAYSRADEIGSLSRSFRAMTHRLSDLDRLKAEFLSFATHELRTPLNVVSGYADLLRDGTYGDLSPSQTEALEAIRDQTRVIAQLVNQLLDIGRLEAGGLRLHVREVASAELFQRIERAFSPLAQKKEITLSVYIDETVPATLDVDADRLSDQVLGNLLSNALKFTPEHGDVRVLVHRDEQDLTIEVSDTGPGIPEDKLPHIFEKYYQVSDEARRRGAGLGLSIARDVVRAHGGTIEAESTPGQGTTFRVRLRVGAGSRHEAFVASSA